MQSSGRIFREIAASYSIVIARLDRATQYSETPMIGPKSRGVLDSRFRGDDSCGLVAIEPSLSFRGNQP